VVRWGARATVVRPSKVRYSLSTTGGHPPRPGHGGYERPLYAQQGRSIYGMNPFEGDHSRILERASPSSFEICGGQAARSTGSLSYGRDCSNQDSPAQTPREAAFTRLGYEIGAVLVEEGPNSEKLAKEKQTKEKGPFHVKRAPQKNEVLLAFGPRSQHVHDSVEIFHAGELDADAPLPCTQRDLDVGVEAIRK
jgi:hypothetical protein